MLVFISGWIQFNWIEIFVFVFVIVGGFSSLLFNFFNANGSGFSVFVLCYLSVSLTEFQIQM